MSAFEWGNIRAHIAHSESLQNGLFPETFFKLSHFTPKRLFVLFSQSTKFILLNWYSASATVVLEAPKYFITSQYLRISLTGWRILLTEKSPRVFADRKK